MGDEDDRLLGFLPEIQEFPTQESGSDFIEGAEWLVHQQRGRIDRHSTGYRGSLTLSTGEVTGPRIGKLLDAAQAKEMIHEFVPSGLGEPRRFEREVDVLSHRPPRQEPIILEYISQAGELVGDHQALVENHVSVDAYSPLQGNEQAAEDVEKRRLPTAARAEDAHKF